MLRIYLFTSCVSLKDSSWKRRAGNLREKDKGWGWCLLTQVIKRKKKKKAHNRNKAIKTNQTYFLSPSLWNRSLKVCHACASKRKQTVTVTTSGKNSLYTGIRCAQPAGRSQHQLPMPRGAQWLMQKTSLAWGYVICSLQYIHVILGYIKEFHVTLLVDWKICYLGLNNLQNVAELTREGEVVGKRNFCLFKKS